MKLSSPSKKLPQALTLDSHKYKMCLITQVKPSLTEWVNLQALLQDAHLLNKDGWGVMYASPEHNSVLAIKGMELADLLQSAHKLFTSGVDFWVHQRKATKGAVTLDNTHPFVCKTMGFMHNGTVNHVPICNGESDSVVLAKYFDEILTSDPELLFKESFQKIAGHFLGNSRAVFLLPSGRFRIITDQPWITWNGLLVSNTYAWTLHKPKQPASTSTSTSTFNQLTIPHTVAKTRPSISQWEGDPYDALGEVEDYWLDDFEDDLQYLLSLEWEELREVVEADPELIASILYTESLRRAFPQR